ncbi:MAG: polyamine aminopropyltransferase [Syntrophomonadaceae bacterium]|nr:polyamine aminopropyltransferase [Syntrophomonadaceae bacterium]
MHDLWLHEKNTEGYGVKWRITEVLHSEKTPYQELAVVDTLEWGRALLLDGAIQITEKDEFIYHEMISHIAMNSHPNPQRVLIIGGGDGGVLRELCRHRRLQVVDMVEIDARVVENSKRFFPAVASAFSDSRLNLYFEDGLAFVKNVQDKYDVVIVDSCDPVGPAVELFSETFYRDLYNILNDDGIAVVQSESPVFYQQTFVSTHSHLASVFPIVRVYLAPVPTYVSGPWSFTAGSKKYEPAQLAENHENFADLKYYDKNVHSAAFALPKYINNLITK